MSAPARGSRFLAIEVQAIPASELSWDRVAQGVAAEALPTRVLHDVPQDPGGVAILSWRWDREANSGRSRNIALALKHAREAGTRSLLVDLVSVDQNQPRDRLLQDIVDFGNLYATIPVIAAYDERHATMDDWSRTLGRPWLKSEIRAYCQNPTHVTYVGFLHDASNPRHLSFANEVSVIRGTGYAATVLEILHGRVQMTDIADFAEILAEFGDVVARCYEAFDRDDYLLTVFLLTALYEKHQQVEHRDASLDRGFRLDLAAPEFESFGLQRFSVGPFDGETRPYEWARTLRLDGHEVAVWWTKMTSSFDRNWVEVLPQAEKRIFDAAGVPDDVRDAYRRRPELKTAFLRIDAQAPTPSIRERAADLDAGRWHEEVPRPGASTVGFDPARWK